MLLWLMGNRSMQTMCSVLSALVYSRTTMWFLLQSFLVSVFFQVLVKWYLPSLSIFPPTDWKEEAIQSMTMVTAPCSWNWCAIDRDIDRDIGHLYKDIPAVSQTLLVRHPICSLRRFRARQISRLAKPRHPRFLPWFWDHICHGHGKSTLHSPNSFFLVYYY